MIQFYALSVFLNVLVGYILVTDGDRIEGASEIKAPFSLNDETFRLILGILTMMAGLLKLLAPIEGDMPIIGDLFPALAGFLAGFILTFEYYRRHATVESEKTERLELVLLGNKKVFGFAVIAVGALHFLFAQALLL